MPRKLELAGMRFGQLVVLAERGKDIRGAYLWACRCDCGTITVARGSQIRRGATRSCGCGVRQAASLPRSHGQTGSPLYLRWRSMIERTRNPNGSEYANYGGRGIAVCARWQSFDRFAEDTGSTFDCELELDRIDVNGNYEPGNCRWATKREQQRNKRTNHRVTWSGRTLTIQEWGELLDVKPNTIVHRLRRGWAVSRALKTGAAPAVLLEIANA